MSLSDLLSKEALLFSVKVGSKKQLLQELSDKASEISGISSRQIFETLLQRERLGSTAVGNGVAIPHGKLERLETIVGIFARLEHPVEFDAPDEQPVDLVFLLLAPEGAGADHLKALSRIARVLRNEETAQQLRDAEDPQALFGVLTENSARDAA